MTTLVLVCIVVFSLLALLNKFSFKMRAVVVPATVIRKQEQQHTGYGRNGSDIIHYDVVSFQPHSSAKPIALTIEDRDDRSPVGSQVQVMYLPGNLWSARLKGLDI